MADITIDKNISHQTFVGWEMTHQIGELEFPASFPLWENSAPTSLADLGITRVRTELASGLIENTTDYFALWLALGEDVASPVEQAEFTAAFETNFSVPVNDNADSNVINTAGFQWSFLDRQMVKSVLPLKAEIEARGESFFWSVCYVHFSLNNKLHTDNPDEYGELILATWQHLEDTYGILPDALEIYLEPTNGNALVWEDKLAPMIVSACDKLTGAGYAKPYVIAPSTFAMGQAQDYYEDLKALNATAASYIDEISYHRYSTQPSPTTLSNLHTLALADGKNTSMLERGGAHVDMLYEDLKFAKVSAWAQYTGIYPSTDNGFQYFTVNINNGVITEGNRTKYLRHYFKFIRPNSVMKEVTDSDPNFKGIAFEGQNGTYVVPIRALASGTVNVKGLPAGTYGIVYTTGNGTSNPTSYWQSLPNQSISEGQDVTFNMPAAGVVTVYDINYLASYTPSNYLQYLIDNHNPLFHYTMEESSSPLMNRGSINNKDLVVSGTPVFNEPSLLKDGSDTAIRFTSGSSATVSSAVTATEWTIMFALKVVSMPSSTVDIVRVGTGSNGVAHHRFRLYQTSQDAFNYSIGVTGSQIGANVYAEEPNRVELNRTHYVVMTGDSVNGVATTWVNALKRSEVSGAILPLSDASITITATNGAEFVIDELTILDSALTAQEVQNLFRTFRDIELGQTEHYIAPDGNYFGRGTVEDPLDIWYGARSALPQAGDTVYLSGGLYELTNPLFPTVDFRYQGSSGNPVVVRAVQGELARISSSLYANIVEVNGSWVEINGLDYAAPDGSLTGIEIFNPHEQRMSWHGRYPGEDTKYMTEGQVVGSTLTSSDPLISLHTSHIGEILEVDDGSGNVLYSGTITAINSINSAELSPPYNGTLTLSPTARMYMPNAVGNRRATKAITDNGSDNKFIGLFCHDTGDVISSFVHAHRTKSYYNIGVNYGWVEADERGHAHSEYWANKEENGRKEAIGNIMLEGGGSAGKFESVSGESQSWVIKEKIMYGTGNHQWDYLHDFLPAKQAVGSINANSDQLTFTNGTGTLSVGDELIVQGAGWFGQKLYTRIKSINNNVATLFNVARTTVSGASIVVATKIDGNNARQNNLLVGVGTSSVLAKDTNVIGNVNLKPFDGRESNNVQIGYSAKGQDAVVKDNLFMGSLTIEKWRELDFQNNIINFQASTGQNTMLAVSQPQVTPTPETIDWNNYTIDNNTYYAVGMTVISGLTLPFALAGVKNRYDNNALPFIDPSFPNNDWQDTSGTNGKFVDVSSTYNDGDMPTTVIVHPQDPALGGMVGRANITIINKNYDTSVDVDLSSTGLVHGQRFLIRDVQCYAEDWGIVYEGFYDENAPVISVPIMEIQQVVNFAALPVNGTYGIAYETTDNGNYYRWGRDGTYHLVDNPVPRTQAIGWTEENGFTPVPSMKPEFLVAQLIPFNEILPEEFITERVSTTEIGLTWNPPALAHTDVKVEYSTNQEDWTAIPLAQNTVNTNISGLNPATTYYFRVKLVDSGTDVWESDVKVRTTTVLYHLFSEPILQEG